MKEAVKKALVSIGAAITAATLHAIGDAARDAIKDKWGKEPEKPKKRRKS